jgi:hypothetical protein
VDGLQTRMAAFDRLMIALKSEDVPRIKQLMAVSLKQGRSINHITEMIYKCDLF